MSVERALSDEACIDPQLTSEQEAMLDHIVDTEGCSYDDAKRQMGLPVDNPEKVIKLINSPVKDLGKTATQDFFCGDCCKYVKPGEKCPHVRVGSHGGRYSSDDNRY